jgi:DNA polymerase (family 10)
MPRSDAQTVGKLLHEYAQRSALRGGNPYSAKASSRAADSLAALVEPLDKLIMESRLTEIPGVGEAIADIVTKLYRTGTHPSLEKLRKEVPAGVLELLAVPGLRPDKMMRLYKDLGISSLAELEAAAQADRIKKTKGLGAAPQTKILQNLVIARSGAGRLHIHRAAALLEHAVKSLQSARPKLTRITVAGDFRRGCELVGDLSVVVEASSSEEVRGGPAPGGLKIHLADDAHFGAALLLATGSVAHLEGLRELAEVGHGSRARRAAQGSQRDRR